MKTFIVRRKKIFAREDSFFLSNGIPHKVCRACQEPTEFEFLVFANYNGVDSLCTNCRNEKEVVRRGKAPRIRQYKYIDGILYLWCWRCKMFNDEGAFRKERARTFSRASMCLSCCRAYAALRRPPSGARKVNIPSQDHPFRRKGANRIVESP